MTDLSSIPEKIRSELCESGPEELASTITHGLGFLLSVAALVIMIVVSGDDPWKITGGAIFGSTLVLLYLSSTLYHTMVSPRSKSFFQVVDHAAIYLLIAGSYTPITLVTLRGAWGWSLFGIVWFMAIAGVMVKAFMKNNREHWLSTALYLIMGWLAVFAFGPLLKALPTPGIVLLVAGGLFYSLGVIFFVWNKLRFNHAIWHLFVLSGSICHALMVILYILR
ncbi:hemolysin III family protein [Verrucomicrobiaceae bacterium R5-34]|uniref:Hemolysin III family protein n=1 Tax=Oceaniferula flava TaxID=2800421 RepID=A0AAE2SEN5_9BACT|nr:hemolysin III family protein [Oceaniferula flavus]MBK1830850.1 hemolysin III family protein [Verrucomicrobiaceae bacterium R5-34]MBK1856493.1 hemolysin III family protein [Oceaniferula flavus]MBM1137800.1 hemolysin III family protein [Oceaniferula flavus]